MKIYKGALSQDEILRNFKDYSSSDFFSSYILNNLSIYDMLAIMGFLFPEFIFINDRIYLYQNYLSYDKNEENRFDNSNKGREMYINNTCITDLFFLKDNYFDKDLQRELGDKILKFWEIKLNRDFPNFKFDLLLFENGLYDESDVCITFCQG